MKRFRMLLAMLLTVALLASVAVISTAEVQVEEDWQADIRKLMDESYAPRTTSIHYDHALGEEADPERHEFGVERVNESGVTMRADFALLATEAFAKEDWDAVDAWLEETVDSAIQGVAADTEALANAIAKAV